MLAALWIFHDDGQSIYAARVLSSEIVALGNSDKENARLNLGNHIARFAID
jgi:hypothetical protein